VKNERFGSVMELQHERSNLWRMTDLQIRIDEGSSGAHILHLIGPLTLSTLFGFQDLVRKAEHKNGLILDLSEVPYMDSAGLGSILGAYTSCQSHGQSFALANVSQRVVTLLQVAKVDALVPRFDTVERAEQHLRTNAQSA